MLLLGGGEGKAGGSLEIQTAANERLTALAFSIATPRIPWESLAAPLLFEAAALHPALKDENGSHAIHRLAAFLDGEVGFTEEAVSFGRG